MDKVWIVISTNSYDEREIEGVFSTKEKAEAVLRFLREDEYVTEGCHVESYELDKFEMNSKGELKARLISVQQELARLEQLFNALES